MKHSKIFYQVRGIIQTQCSEIEFADLESTVLLVIEGANQAAIFGKAQKGDPAPKWNAIYHAIYRAIPTGCPPGDGGVGAAAYQITNELLGVIE